MTKKQVLRFNRLFNDLVQKQVNGRNAFNLSLHQIDYLGGSEIHITSDTLIWLDEMHALQTICRDMCVQCCIELDRGRIVIH